MAMDHKTQNETIAIDAYSDWLDEYDMPISDDTAAEYVGLRGKELADYERAAIVQYADEFGEL